MGRVHQVLFSIRGMEILYLQEFREIGIMLHKGCILFSEMQNYFFLPYQGKWELSILILLELVGVVVDFGTNTQQWFILFVPH